MRNPPPHAGALVRHPCPVDAQDDHAGDNGATAAADDEPRIGPKILGVAPEPKPLPVVKAKLREKPKRDPLPWPELRAVVAQIREETEDVNDLKDLFRLLPADVRDETVEGVRGFRKGARRPLSQHAAKQLARAVHTSRRQKRNAQPGTAVGEALAQAIVGELIASLDVEKAAEVILPKRDLLERESRAARKRQRDEEDRRKDEVRRQRREDNRGVKDQMSFGTFSGNKIQGIEQLAGLFGDEEQAGEPAPTEETAAPDEPVSSDES